MSKSKLFRSVVALVTGLLLLFSTMTVGFAATTAGTVNPTKIYAAKADGTVLEFNFTDLLNAYVDNNTAYKTLWESVSAGITTVVYDGKNVDFKDFFDAFAALKVKNFAEYVALADAKYNELPDTVYTVGSTGTASTTPTYLGKLEVASVSAITNNLLYVNLSTALTTTPTTNKFVVKDASGNAVEVKSVELSADKKIVKVKTADMTPGATYTIAAGDTTNSFVANVADTTAPKLSSATTLSNVKVRLTFNETLDKDAAQNIANYTIGNITVLTAVYDATNKTVTLTTSAQTAGTIYKVTVANVKDMAGNAINSDYDEAQFGGVAVDTTKPEALAAEVVTNSKVRVLFDESMNVASAQNIANYKINNSLSVLKAEYDESDLNNDGTDELYVTLTTSAQTPGTIYTITLSNVTDESANVIDADYDQVQFGGVALDTVKPQATLAATISNTKADVYFDSDMDKASVENILNYKLDNNLTVLKAEQDEDDFTLVHLTTTAQAAGTIYTLTVTGVKDESGNVIDSDYDEVQFGGVLADTDAPEVNTILPTSNTSLVVTFNEEVEKTSAEFAANYYIQGLGYATKAVLGSDGVTVTLTTLTQEFGKQYKLDVKNVKDIAGNVMEDSLDNTFASAGYADTTAPVISTASSIARDMFDVVFNEKIANGTTAGNYELDGSALPMGTTLTLLPDDKTVRIVLPSALTAGNIHEIAVVSGTLADLNGNVVNTTAEESSKKFVATSLVATAPKLSAVTATNINTVTVVFNNFVDAASETNTNYTITEDNGSALGYQPVTAVLGDDGKTVTLYFDSATQDLVRGHIYKIAAENISDITGTYTLGVIGSGTESTKTFAGPNVNNSAPAIASVACDDKQVVTVKFNKALDITTSQVALETAGTWNVEDAAGSAIGATIVPKVVDETTVRLYLDSALTAGSIYKVNVVHGAGADDSVFDMTGLAVADGVTTTAKQLSFVGASKAHAIPAIASATVLDEYTVRVAFNNLLDVATTALDLTDETDALFTFVGITPTGYDVADTFATPDDMTYDITIAGAKFVKGQTYSVKADTSIVDFTTAAVDNTKTKSFVGIAPDMISATYTAVTGGHDKVVLTFNSEIGSFDETHMTIVDTSTPNLIAGIAHSAVSISGNKVTITLTADATAGEDVVITLTGAAASDKAGTPNTNVTGDTITISR